MCGYKSDLGVVRDLIMCIIPRDNEKQKLSKSLDSEVSFLFSPLRVFTRSFIATSNFNRRKQNNLKLT